MRAMSSDMLTALQQPVLYPVLFLTATFKTGPIYIWTGIGSISWNGFIWLGVGNLLSMSVVEEGSNIDARGITVSLSGIDVGLLADALQEFQISSNVTIYMGLLAGSPLALLVDPFISWQGQMDQPIIDVGAEQATITIKCESKLIMHNVSVERRYTQDDQTINFPGDLGFQFVNSLCNQSLTWGRVPTAIGRSS